jgi:hypothetical protein|tara:strand:+ start:304 stop:723 length:420 start_codon:yes stop_codon:yes gene_type:complete
MLINSIPQYIQGITNAKIDLTATDLETLFTVPSDADFNAVVINSILVSNDDTSNASTITVTVVGNGLNSAGAVTAHTFNLFKDTAIAAKTTVELLTKDIILKSGEVLKVQAGHVDRLHVLASIQELSKTRITTSAIVSI